MSFTNKTPNLNLPQWIDTDTPTWLVDMNNAFEKIDESVTSVKNAGDTNKTNIEAISQTQATQAEQIQDLTDKVTADTTQLSQVQAQVNVNTSHLSDLDNDITQTNETVADNFTQLQAADTTISNTVNGISATVAEHGNAITELQATTGGYDERIESAETNIQALENKDVELSGKIQSNETNITSLTTEQQELSGEVAELSANVNAITQGLPIKIVKNEFTGLTSQLVGSSNNYVRIDVPGVVSSGAIIGVEVLISISNTTDSDMMFIPNIGISSPQSNRWLISNSGIKKLRANSSTAFVFFLLGIVVTTDPSSYTLQITEINNQTGYELTNTRTTSFKYDLIAIKE